MYVGTLLISKGFNSYLFYYQPSQVGVVLSSIAFNTIVNGVSIAPVASNGVASLLPVSTSSLSLVGRLVPQDSQQGLDTVSAIFNNFIHGKDSEVMVQGAGAGPGDVSGPFFFLCTLWLIYCGALL